MQFFMVKQALLACCLSRAGLYSGSKLVEEQVGSSKQASNSEWLCVEDAMEANVVCMQGPQQNELLNNVTINQYDCCSMDFVGVTYNDVDIGPTHLNDLRPSGDSLI